MESEKVRNDLTEECEIYKPVAESAATLYFITLSLQSINNFYLISIDSFVRIYQNIFSSVSTGKFFLKKEI